MPLLQTKLQNQKKKHGIACNNIVVIPDDVLIEKVLLHLDIEDVQALFYLFPKNEIKKVWQDVVLPRDPLYRNINKLYAFMFFNIKHPDRYIRYYKNKYIYRMKGLTENTEKIFEAVSLLDFIKDYTLIGGTAISLQIGKRLSEDLDFCKWSTNLKTDNPAVDWPQIQKQLETIGKVDIEGLGFDQVDFFINDVKVTFMTLPRRLSPVTEVVPILNNIKAADLVSLGTMNVELTLSRREFRDYYDIYSLLKEGQSLKSMVDGASKYSNREFKRAGKLNAT